MSWEDRAECRKYEPETWIPKRDNARAGKVERARRVCISDCPVQRDCADYAITTGQRIGVWGGVDLGDSTAKLSKETETALRLAAKWVRL